MSGRNKGRVALPAKVRRDHAVQSRLNELENELFISACNESGVSRSEFVRKAVVEHSRKVLNKEQ